MKLCKAFTRIDLVVTLLCAAFLVMTMGAVGNRGRRRAQQLVCASQLGKWGAVIAAYNADNENIPTIMWRAWGLFPVFMSWLDPGEYNNPPAPEMISSEWSVWKVNPYLDCVEKDFLDTGRATEIMACPSTNVDLLVEMIQKEWEDPFMSSERWILPAYSYWGGVGEMISKSNTPKSEYSDNFVRDLTLDTMSSKRLLMSEDLFFESYFVWQYNHGANGWAYAFEWLNTPLVAESHQRLDGEQDATGRNQLFGDGRVQWRSISLEFEDNLPSQRSDLGDVAGFREDEWNGPGSGFICHANDGMYY